MACDWTQGARRLGGDSGRCAQVAEGVREIADGVQLRNPGEPAGRDGGCPVSGTEHGAGDRAVGVRVAAGRQDERSGHP